MSQGNKLAVQAVNAPPCLVAKMRSAPAKIQLVHQLGDVISAVGMKKRPLRAKFATAVVIRYRDGDRCLMDIQSDEHATSHLVFPPFSLARHQPIWRNA